MKFDWCIPLFYFYCNFEEKRKPEMLPRKIEADATTTIFWYFDASGVEY